MKNLHKKYEILKKRLRSLGYICLGSINEVYICCGSRYCDCKKNKKKRHGPYYLWTRKESRKTKSKYLSKKQVVACRKFIKNYDELKSIIDEMKKISEKVLEKQK